MPKLDLARLRRSLKTDNPAPAYYVHGAEAILKDEAVALILGRALGAETRDFNLDVYSAQNLDPAGLPAACATLPMMAERRVVVLRDVETWKRKSKGKQPALRYLENPVPETVLVMVQSGDDAADEDLVKGCVEVECTAPTGEQLESWLDARLASHGVAVVPEAREYLIRATGGDLGMLNAEVQKLSGLDTGAPIDGTTVAALVGIRFGETADDWRDAVIRDDTVTALRLLPRVLERTSASAVQLVAFLGTSFLALRWAAATAASGNARGSTLADRIKTGLLFKVRVRLGSYDPFAKLIAGAVERWPVARVDAGLQAMLRADIALKNTTISTPAQIVTDLVLALGSSRGRKAA